MPTWSQLRLTLTLCILTCGLAGCVPWYHTRYGLPNYDPTLGVSQQEMATSLALGNHYIHERDYSGIETRARPSPERCTWHGGIRRCVAATHADKYADYHDVPYGPENL